MSSASSQPAMASAFPAVSTGASSEMDELVLMSFRQVRLDELQLARPPDSFPALTGAELLVDRRDVRLDRVHRKVELDGDLSRCQARGQVGQDGLLPRRQLDGKVANALLRHRDRDAPRGTGWRAGPAASYRGMPGEQIAERFPRLDERQDYLLVREVQRVRDHVQRPPGVARPFGNA